MGLEQTPSRPKRSPWVIIGPILAIVVVVGIVVAALASGGDDDGGDDVKVGGPGVPVFYNDAKSADDLDKYTWQASCNTETGEVAIPILNPPPCVPTVAQAENGGATSTGVTAETVRVGYYIGKPDPILDTLAKQAGAYDEPANSEKAYKQYVEIYQNQYELHGRKVELVRIDGTGTGSDAVAARRDAQTAVSKGVFAVMGGPAQAKEFSDELTKNKVLCLAGCIIAQPQKYYLDHQPYLWPTGPSPDQTSTMTTELIKNQLAGKPADFGGPDVNGKERTFVLLTYDTPDGQFTSSWDDLEAKVKATGVNLVDRVNYYLDLPNLEADARATSAKLVDIGATSILFTGDPIFPQFLTAQMTAAGYFPEWIMSGTVLADTNVFARKFDQEQWKHAIGIQLIPARVDKELQDSYTLHQWWFGTPPPTENNYGIIKGAVELLFNGLQLAGPKLTPESFKAGMDARPPSVSTTDPTLNTIVTYGQHDIWPDTPNDPAGLDNAGVMFWDPEAEGPDETGTVAKGMYRLMDGGLRYLPGKWPTEPLSFFDSAGTITIYNASDLPAALKPAVIPVPAGAPANK